MKIKEIYIYTYAAPAKLLQLCPTLCNPHQAPHPWDSPGKNTGVGCHFLLQCMKVKSESEVTQLFVTLSDPMDCSLPGSSIHGIFQAFSEIYIYMCVYVCVCVYIYIYIYIYI